MDMPTKPLPTDGSPPSATQLSSREKWEIALQEFKDANEGKTWEALALEHEEALRQGKTMEERVREMKEAAARNRLKKQGTQANS